MTTHQHTWLCSYDIRHPKRLAKIHQLLAESGRSVNFSVFYLKLDLLQYQELCRKIEKIIQAEDDVRLYRCVNWQRAHIVMESNNSGLYFLN